MPELRSEVGSLTPKLAVTRVRNGQRIGALAKDLDLIEQTLCNRVNAAKPGKLTS